MKLSSIISLVLLFTCLNTFAQTHYECQTLDYNLKGTYRTSDRVHRNPYLSIDGVNDQVLLLTCDQDGRSIIHADSFSLYYFKKNYELEGNSCYDHIRKLITLLDKRAEPVKGIRIKLCNEERSPPEIEFY